MTDGQTNSLRQKLATVYLDREYDGDEGTTLDDCHPEVRSQCLDFADAALPAVVDWLRAEAENRRRLARADIEGYSGDLLIAALVLHGRADAIDRELGK